MTVFLQLFVLLLILFSARGWGGLILRSLKYEFSSRTEFLTLSCLAGLGMIAYLLLILGLAGFFYSPWLWAVLVIGFSLIWASAKDFFLAPSASIGKGYFNLMLGAVTAVVLLTVVLQLNFPPVTADELSYHLTLPKLFLLKHQIFYSPYHVNSLFPLLTELLYSFGISLQGNITIKGISLIFGVLTSLLIYFFSRRFLKDVPALWPSLLFLTIPVVQHQMTLAKNDLALTAFVFGAYFALFVWMETQEKKWLILAGLFAGFALGVKYLALFSFCIQGLVILIFHGFRRSKAPRIFWDLILFTLITAAVGCVWYLRASLATGNPFYPYLTRVFGGAGLENPLRLAEKGVGKDFLSLILLPWNATFYPDKFGGMSNQWGPLFLAFLPWLALLRKKGSTWRYFLAITALSTLLWFFTKQNLRFLIPTLPFFCILVAAVLADLTQRGKWIGISAKAFFLAFIGLHVGIGIYHLRGDHPKHPVSKVAAYLNSEGKKPFKILSQEQRVYDFDGEAVRENIYRRVTQYPDQYASRPQAFREALRAENFTHVLLISNMDTPIELKNLVEGKSGKGTQPRKVFETSYIRSETGKQQGYLLYEL